MFGFLLWNLDNKFCKLLQQYRSNVDSFFKLDSGPEWRRVLFNGCALSLKALSEFHSLWHIFTGYAAFMTILFLIEVHFKHYMLTNNIKENQTQKPVETKLFNFYYHLSNSLLTVGHETETSLKKKPKKGEKII